MLAGAVALFLESRLAGEGLEQLAAASSAAWLGLAYLAVFGSLVGFTAFAYCLNELPASTVGTYAYVNPVVAVTLGALLLDEPLSAGLLLGGAAHPRLRPPLVHVRRPEGLRPRAQASGRGSRLIDLIEKEGRAAPAEGGGLAPASRGQERPRRAAVLDRPAAPGPSRTGCRSAA